jgi:hypothetical protein
MKPMPVGMPKETPLNCKDCQYWYGAEDDEVGPCSIKNMRGEKRYMTIGHHDCDEGFFAKHGKSTTADLYAARDRARTANCEGDAAGRKAGTRP